MYRLTPLCVLVVTGALLADPAAETAVEKGRKDLAAAQDRALKSLRQKFEASLKELRTAGDYRALKAAEAQVQTFETDGTAPTAPRLARAYSDYQRDVLAAQLAWKRTLEPALKELTRANRLSEAEEVAVELKAVEQAIEDQAARQKAAEKPRDGFAAGTVWKGSLEQQWNSGKPVSMTAELTVTERNGERFKARVEVTGDQGRNVRIVEGTLSPVGDLKWTGAKTTILEGKGKAFDHAGKLKGDDLRLQFRGVNAGNQQTSGEYQFKLVRD